MPNHLHLTLQDRSIICARLTEGVSFRQIGLELDKDPGTISREVKLRRSMIETGYSGHSLPAKDLLTNMFFSYYDGAWLIPRHPPPYM